MKLNIAILTAAALGASVVSSFAAPVVLSEGTYTENFNGISNPPNSGVDNPAPGWDFRTFATASSLGNLNTFPTLLRAWTHGTGQGKNVSSTNIPSTSTATEQNANTNRALGMRQVIGSTSGFDPGAALNFNFATTGLAVQQLKLDLLMLDVTTGSSTFQLQIGFGATPSSFTTLYSWSDPGVWGSTTVTFDRDDFGSLLDGQSNVWFRVAAITPATSPNNVLDMVAIDNFSVTTAAPVPEPSSFGLLLSGMLGGAAFFRRRK